MFIQNIFKSGIFHINYRRQLLVTLSATLITFIHGIGTGWLSPMLPKLQSVETTPLDFVLDVHETSWLGACISIGGFTGNFIFSFVMNRFGRKAALYGMAIPNTCIWFLFYFAQSVEWLYVARVCAGLTGGGASVVLPIFLGEISDNKVRGRFGSFFALTATFGIMTGYIISSHVPYHVIPCVVVVLPLIYFLLCLRYPEPPQQLLRQGKEEAAKKSLKYYRNCDGPNASLEAQRDYQKQFDEMSQAIAQQMKQQNNESLALSDFCNKTAVRAILTGLVLMIANIFTGTFAFINYMSNIFEAAHTQLEPNTNTIIIGAVQVVGALAAIHLVDRYGRKVLLMISCGGGALATTAFGIYAFLAEETDTDLSAFSAWLPVTLMSFVIFLANVGVTSVSLVVLVEVLPQRIRAVATSACLGCLSTFSFTSLRTFPLLMHYFGLAATMWACGSVCAFCLFYFSVFLEETKGKSIYN